MTGLLDLFKKPKRGIEKQATLIKVTDINRSGVMIASGKESTINNYGLSYTEARQIALDTFDASFYRLAGV
jgi:hypothetical protein